LHTYCEEHQREVWRKKQTPNKKYIICVDCGAEVEKRGNTRRCKDCAAEARRKAHAERMRAVWEKQRAVRAATPKLPKPPKAPKAPAEPKPPKPRKLAEPKAPKPKAPKAPKGMDFVLEDKKGNIYHVRALVVKRVAKAQRGKALFKLRGTVVVGEEHD
jgi:sRNA-binding protein